jgi:hypothetical protein
MAATTEGAGPKLLLVGADAGAERTSAAVAFLRLGPDKGNRRRQRRDERVKGGA